MTIRALPLTIRDITATERNLEALYAAAYKGLKGDSLALAAGLLPAEYRRLASADPLVELAVAKGKADAERQLSDVLHTAALAGDAKVALEILRHRHAWVAAQQVQVSIEGQISVLAALEKANERVVTGYAIIDEAQERANAPGLLTNQPNEAADGYANFDTRTA